MSKKLQLIFLFFAFGLQLVAQIAKPTIKTNPTPATKVKIVQKVVYKDNDRDGDGIIDNMDKCPDEWGEMKNDGCPKSMASEAEENLSYARKYFKVKDYTNAYTIYNNPQYYVYFTSSDANALAEMYYLGKGATENNNEALKWYKISADKGNPEGQASLGIMYYHGEGVNQDFKLAFYWFSKSANQGYALGQTNLGYMYNKGEGVDKDYSQAIMWYRKAANQGSDDAQLKLGYMYENGRGVGIDNEEAAIWYRKSASQGNVQAQSNLGALYYWGVSLKQDLVEAKKWLKMAAAQGDERSIKKLKDLESKLKESEPYVDPY